MFLAREFFQSRILEVAYSKSHTQSRILLSVYSFVFTAVSVLSCSAGLKLWLVKPDAVRFAKRYLLTYLLANIAYFVFWLIVMWPNRSLSLAQMGVGSPCRSDWVRGDLALGGPPYPPSGSLMEFPNRYRLHLTQCVASKAWDQA
jgi:hypothetical protein